MGGRGWLEYWRELVLVLVMLTVLLLDLTLTQSLWPYGEDGGESNAVISVE